MISSGNLRVATYFFVDVIRRKGNREDRNKYKFPCPTVAIYLY